MNTILYCKVFDTLIKIRVLRRGNHPALYMQLHIPFKKEAERDITNREGQYEDKVQPHFKMLAYKILE